MENLNFIVYKDANRDADAIVISIVIVIGKGTYITIVARGQATDGAVHMVIRNAWQRYRNGYVNN